VNEQTLAATAQAMVTPGKGIFAADVPLRGLMDGWWGPMKQPNTIEAARDFQEMLFRTPKLGEYISSIIVFYDVLDQQSKDGTSFVELLNRQGIMVGITPTAGSQKLGGSSGEYIPTGLDGLPKKLERWRELGARFVKWRVRVKVGPGLPTPRAIKSNARSVAEYAILAQETGLVPIVEPEVDMRGKHDIKRHFEVTEWFLHQVFETLYEHQVITDGIVLKTNMVVPGSDCPDQASVDMVATETLKCMRRAVPAAVPGIGFLSGGQSDEKATSHLNAMNALGPQPWALSFSYGRAIGRAAMLAWDGKTDGSAGQMALLHRARMNSLASLGKWSAGLENQPEQVHTD
jgi:fructose-bisphosphate aldolase class I